MDSVNFNDIFSLLKENTRLQFNEDDKNDMQDVFENIFLNSHKTISEEQKNTIITLNNLINSSYDMNLDDIYAIMNYLSLQKSELFELPNFKRNQPEIIIIYGILLQKCRKNKDKSLQVEEKQKVEEKVEESKQVEESSQQPDFDKILDSVLQSKEFDVDKELDDELAEELEELNKEEQQPKNIENSLGDLSKLIDLAKNLTSKVNLDDNPIDFNKLTDKDYFNKVIKNIQEKDDNLENSEEISKIVESNPLLKSIHDQLLNRFEKSENIDYDFVKDISEKIVKDL